MNLGEWLGSKKFKTALVAAVVPFVAYYLDIPQEVAMTAVGGLVSAILGFAHQDYGKARDALSGAQLEVVGAALVQKLAASGKMDAKTAKVVTDALNGIKDGDMSSVAGAVADKIIEKKEEDAKDG